MYTDWSVLIGKFTDMHASMPFLSAQIFFRESCVFLFSLTTHARKSSDPCYRKLYII